MTIAPTLTTATITAVRGAQTRVSPGSCREYGPSDDHGDANPLGAGQPLPSTPTPIATTKRI
jgi:hypothetical protein